MNTQSLENRSEVAFKVEFGEELRRFTLAAPITFDAVVTCVRNLFGFGSSADLVLKYKDDENDVVTFTTTEELNEAIRLPRIPPSVPLRLFVQLKDKVTIQRISTPVSLPTAPTLADAPRAPSDCSNWRLSREERMKVCKAHRERQRMREERWKLRDERWKAREERCAAKAVATRIDAESSTKSGSADGGCRGAWRVRLDSLNPEEREMCRERRRGCCRGKREHGEGRIGGRRRARFVKHVTVPDCTEMTPGQAFTKTWRFRNESDDAWPAGCSILFISYREGDSLGAPESVLIPGTVNPGEEVDVSVDMHAPQQEGRYVAFWRLADPSGKKFGHRVWVKIQVVASLAKKVMDPTCSDSCMDKMVHDSEAEIQLFFQTGDAKQEEPGCKAIKTESPATSESYASKPSVASLLRQLKEIGFDEDVGRNIQLIKQYEGDLSMVVAALMAD